VIPDGSPHRLVRYRHRARTRRIRCAKAEWVYRLREAIPQVLGFAFAKTEDCYSATDMSQSVAPYRIGSCAA